MPAIGLVGSHARDEIPASHRDLVECPPVAALSTVGADGYPQTSAVWCDFDGEWVRVNTMRGFTKERNMRRDPRVTILCYDPRQPLRGDPRGVGQEVAQGGGSPAGLRGDQLVGANVVAGRGVELDPSLFHELHDCDGGEQLGNRADAEDRVVGDRRVRRDVREPVAAEEHKVAIADDCQREANGRPAVEDLDGSGCQP